MKSQKSEPSHRCDVMIRRHNLEAIRANIQSDSNSLFIEINGLWFVLYVPGKCKNGNTTTLEAHLPQQVTRFPSSSLGSADFLLTRCQSCPISQQLNMIWSNLHKIVNYRKSEKIQSTFYHVHISVKPLGLDLYWRLFILFPPEQVKVNCIHCARVCLMASAASGARAGPWSPASRGQSRGQTQTIGAGAETRSRREESEYGLATAPPPGTQVTGVTPG